ncbi:RimK family alpha-L-glutamate ligase [Candidatus Uhrbacteria bacterium]|nr:RimK family alpha-L-glutamate ligase [Candidatus Uhrbacteria bacterium]
MHIAILVFEQEKKELLPGSKMLMDKAHLMKHEVTILRENELYILYDGQRESLFLAGKPLEKFDAVIVRPSFTSDPSIHASLIRQFELQGYLVINTHSGVHRAKNKVRTLQLLHHYGIPMPKTVVLFGEGNLDEVMHEFKYPVIVKSAYGAGGSGVFIAESKRSLKPVVEHLLKRSKVEPIKIQEYIAESKGKDLRLFIVGKKVVATMQRSAKKGEFRSNFHKGGSVKGVQPTKQEEEMALAASIGLGLDISGVDILRTKKGPVIIEVNSQPGLEGISLATGVDVAKKIIEYTEKCANLRKRNGQRPAKEKRKSQEG